MAIQSLSFVDPLLMQQQRMNAFDTQTRTADLRLQGQRIQEDANLFRPFLERRFGRQSRRMASNVAGRGFHGQGSGIMRSQLGELGEEQMFTGGEFERGTARSLEDVERAIANLTSRNTLMGAENVREGAGRAAQRAYPQFPSF